MRKGLIGAFVTTVVMVATIGLTPAAANAEPSPPNCPPGNFCAYSGQNQTGTLLLKVGSNWTGTVTAVHSVFNNGTYWPGADHISLTYYDPLTGTYGSVPCLHYNPGPGTYKLNFPWSRTLTSVTWRGEC